MALSHGRNRSYHGHPVSVGSRRRRVKVPPHVLRGLASPQAKGSSLWVKLLIGLIVLAILIPSLGLAGAGAAYARTAASLRGRLDTLAAYHEQAFQTSRIFDRNGELLYEFVNAGRRDPVRLDQIAEVLRDATISIEDKSFYQHVGVDFVGLAKAVYRNFTSGAEVSGGSTITQQLIKNIILSEEERAVSNRYRRKLTEIILAQQLDEEYSKDEVLELYLNEINYGNLAYGIQAAAKTYFGTNASELTLNQASLLAGLPQLPTEYNPIQYLDGQVLRGVQLKRGWLNPSARLPHGITRPRQRQVDVLRQMVLNGKITEREAVTAISEDLVFASQDVAINAPHFVFYVRQLLENDPSIGPLLANEGGLSITTTLDLRVQRIAQTEASQHIDRLVADGRNIHNAAVVVMQPRSGQILSMLGSVDYNKSQVTTTPGESGNVVDGNVNVTTSERQPGSALKPFTYLSALEQGKFDAGSILWDVETRFRIKKEATEEDFDDPESWYGPKNFDQKWHGPLRMRESLANSLNMPAVKALRQAGIQNTLDLLHRAGINGLQREPSYYGLALTLGGGEVTPLDLTTAYNTLANDGLYVPPTPILRITDRDGNALPFVPGTPRQAADPKNVAIVRDFMGDNEARTPLFGEDNPLNPSRKAHAKTGTTDDFRDAWAMGFTPYVTVGVWTGNNNNEKTEKVESTQGGGVIWNRIMEALFNDPDLDHLLRGPDLSAPLEFPALETYGLEKRKVCEIGGRFGQRTEEWFVKGEGEPETDCDLHQTVTAVRDGNSYCLPLQGVSYGDLLVTVKAWNLPESDEEERLVKDPTWEGGALADLGAAVVPERICSEALTYRPTATPLPVVEEPVEPEEDAEQPRPGEPGEPREPAAPRAPTPAPPPEAKPEPQPAPVAQIPSLVGLGENQARDVLASLGVTTVAVDYQGPDRLGPLYDQTPAYVVVSHMPGPGTPVSPGMSVTLGIRAP